MYTWIIIGIVLIVILIIILRYQRYGLKFSTNKQDLQHLMDRLWAEHVIWTRLYIIAVLNNVTSASDTAARLMFNQEEIGNAIGSLYGRSAGNKLTELLKSHISIAVQLISAIQSNNTYMINLASEAWYKNADDISVFLSSANPYIPENEMKKMMRNHLDLTSEEVQAQYRQDWSVDIKTFDKVMQQAMHMSKVLTNAISMDLKL